MEIYIRYAREVLQRLTSAECDRLWTDTKGEKNEHYETNSGMYVMRFDDNACLWRGQ